MKNNWKKIFRLAGYGHQFRLQLILGVSFFILGLVIQIGSTLSVAQTNFGEFGTFAFLMMQLCGDVLIVSAAAMPAQILLSMDCALMTQASPWKKKLQTSIFSIFICIPTLIVLTLSLALGTTASAKMPGNSIWIAQSFLICGIITAFLLIFWPITYKYYRISMIIIICGIFFSETGIIFSDGMLENGEIIFSSLRLPSSPAVCILLAYVIVLAACGINFLLARALYKKPLSKQAFGVFLQKWL
ncbi:MAG: hypothetical protein LUD14_02680 [Clostridiales bacterium]|nr:hypothetical protein [Clostridiales bacterium]